MRTIEGKALLLLTSLTAAVVGCSSTYHPEYHPVTVSNFSQSLDYPVVVNNGVANHGVANNGVANGFETTGALAPVYIVPATIPGSQAAYGVLPPPGPPPGFFH